MNLPIRRNAQVLSVRPLSEPPAPAAHLDPRQIEYLEGTRYMLLGELKKLIRRGEVKALGPIQIRPSGMAGVWVQRLRPPTPLWKKVTGWSALALAIGGALLLALGLAISALASIPIIVWVVLGVLILAGGTGGTTVIVKVWVK